MHAVPYRVLAADTTAPLPLLRANFLPRLLEFSVHRPRARNRAPAARPRPDSPPIPARGPLPAAADVQVVRRGPPAVSARAPGHAFGRAPVAVRNGLLATREREGRTRFRSAALLARPGHGRDFGRARSAVRRERHANAPRGAREGAAADDAAVVSQAGGAGGARRSDVGGAPRGHVVGRLSAQAYTWRGRGGELPQTSKSQKKTKEIRPTAVMSEGRRPRRPREASAPHSRE